MKERGMRIPLGLPEKAAMQEVLCCNEVTARFGLMLTQAEAAALAETRRDALVKSGRVEFGGGAMQSLILAFCDTPYIVRDMWADTLSELARIFYDFKTGSIDEVDDAEATALMRRAFDEWRGALGMVESAMETAARNVRYGRAPEDEGEPEDTEDEANE
jgi:hypothetical protein